MAGTGATLTDQEKARVRHHLGFLNVGQGTSIGLGVPTVSELGFILERTMNDILPAAIQTIRDTLTECDCIELQMKQGRTRLIARKTDGVELFGPEEIAELENLYVYWTSNLADELGAEKNPFSKKHQRLGGETFVQEPV